MSNNTSTHLSGDSAKTLLESLPNWGNLTTIIFQGGCVFEFKGSFPKGEEGSGFYNLSSGGQGFEGHINLDKIDRISFQDKEHRGRQSYAFVFEDGQGKCIFKVFLGRDESGELIESQVSQFKTIQANLSL